MNSYNVISENSDTDLAEHRLVKFTATGVAYNGVGENPAGTTLNPTAAGKPAGVALKKNFGLHFVTVADATAIAAGDELQAAANGQVTKLAGGPSIGVAREPSTEAGSIIRAYLYAGGANEAAEAGEGELDVPQTGEADLAGANLVGVDGTANNAAPLVGTETRLDAIESKINAILAKLETAGIFTAV